MGKAEKDYYDKELYHKDLYDQYKLFVEMTDRMHQRRQQLVNWFITLNTGFIALIGIMIEKCISSWIIAGLSLVGIVNCFLWKAILNSYKQISSGHFKVIHEIEHYLPLKLFTAEWEALDAGENNRTYIPVTKLEQIIPFVFMAVFVLIIVIAVIVKIK